MVINTPNLHFHHQDRTIPNKYYILQPRSARSKVEQIVIIIATTLLSYFIVVGEEIVIIISLISLLLTLAPADYQVVSADDLQMKSVHLRFPLYCFLGSDGVAMHFSSQFTTDLVEH